MRKFAIRVFLKNPMPLTVFSKTPVKTAQVQHQASMLAQLGIPHTKVGGIAYLTTPPLVSATKQVTAEVL
jgi:hypothetical protein